MSDRLKLQECLSFCLFLVGLQERHRIVVTMGCWGLEHLILPFFSKIKMLISKLLWNKNFGTCWYNKAIRFEMVINHTTALMIFFYNHILYHVLSLRYSSIITISSSCISSTEVENICFYCVVQQNRSSVRNEM